MKDREIEKDVGRPISLNSTYFEEFTSDGKAYYSLESLKDFNSMLMCESREGIIIIGPKGSCKTTFMQQFVQQDINAEFGIDSLKVIHIFEEFLSECKKEEDIAQNFLKLCQYYKNQAVIFFLKVNDANTLEYAIQIFSRYAKKIKEQYNITFFKLVIEYTVEDRKEREQFETLDVKSFWKYYIQLPYEFEKRVKIYELMAKELSSIYNVKINKQMTYFSSVVVMGCVDKDVNLKEFYNYLEYLFASARREKQKFISKSFVKKAFSKIFDVFERRGENQIRRTAYHESGHTMFTLINSNFRLFDMVTVIPGVGYNGVTRHSWTEESDKHIRDRHAVICEIARLIAGREAERLLIYPYNPNKGAFSDLKKAKELVDELIYEFGFSDSIGNNLVLKRDEPISDIMRRHIEIERNRIIDEATQMALEAVFKHKDFIEKLAQKLISNLYVTGEEARKMWKEHLKDLDEKGNNNS